MSNKDNRLQNACHGVLLHDSLRAGVKSNCVIPVSPRETTLGGFLSTAPNSCPGFSLVPIQVTELADSFAPEKLNPTAGHVIPPKIDRK